MRKRFLVNKTTKVIHDLRAQTSQCNIPSAREDDENLEYVGTSGLEVRLQGGQMHLCDFCFSSEEEG